MTTNFRPEIAGLRALAVLGVVLFHLKIPGSSGGFVGVDVFFVISGFLITRNILRDEQKNRFSLGQFYLRRTRRIYPALIATVILTYIAGALWCAPLMFLDVAKECTHALLSIANIQYWRESHKYFAPNSDELAMLHFWSLSVEEQFYLVWPLLIVWAHRIGRLREVIIAATVASLLASVAVARTDPVAVFFLMPFRIFEFGLGAITPFLEILLGHRSKQILSAGGIVSIVASAVLVRPDSAYLLVTLVPCLGAVSIIMGGGKTIAAKLLIHPAAVAVGTISYSLYLCHWPIIFFSRFIFGPIANSPSAILIEAATMLCTAFLMYRFIERPFIQSDDGPTVNFWKYSGAFWSIILTLVAITHATFLLKGFAWRLPAERAEIAHLQEFPSGEDIFPVDGPFAMQLVGDSHAIQYMAGLSPLAKRFGIKMEILATPGCPILFGVTLKQSRRLECVIERNRSLERIQRTNLPIIFAQKWDFYDDATIDYDFEGWTFSGTEEHSYTKLEEALDQTIGQFATSGRHTLIIGRQVESDCAINLPRLLAGPLPHAPLPPCPARKRKEMEQSGIRINDMLARVQAKWPDRIELLRPVDYFCDDECPTVKDGLWLYRDGSHFTVAGSNYMVARAAAPIGKFLFKTRTHLER